MDIAKKDKRTPVQKLASYYRNEHRDPDNTQLILYRFKALSTKFELTEHGPFSEVLYPETIYDLIDYYLRENIQRGQKWRICKNCGRYFPMTGRASAEYCDRAAAASGSTCKDVGSTKTWESKMQSEEGFQNYRREYKRRYAWIRLGRWTQEEFGEWSRQARTKKMQCDRGSISEEEFAAWLKNS